MNPKTALIVFDRAIAPVVLLLYPTIDIIYNPLAAVPPVATVPSGVLEITMLEV